MERKEIEIPDNGKVTIDGRKIIIEYPKKKLESEFKNGQFLTHRNGKDRWLIIFKDKKDREINSFEYHVMLSYYDEIYYNDICDHNGWHESTESEKKELLEALHKEGKDWDAEKLQIVDYVWKPKREERYFCPSINNDSLFIEMTWINDMADNKYFKRGLVFKTKEEAIACAKKMLESIKTR